LDNDLGLFLLSRVIVSGSGSELTPEEIEFVAEERKRRLEEIDDAEVLRMIEQTGSAVATFLKQHSPPPHAGQR
jgi:hypothetical protein